MWTSTQYAARQTLREDQRGGLYRGTRIADGRAVLIRVIAPAFRQAELPHLRHAYDTGLQLDVPAVIRPLAFNEERGELTLEDDGSEPLERRFPAPLGIEQFLVLAVNMSHALAQAHAAGLIHKDIKPDNFLIHPRTTKVKLSNLDLASLGEPSTQHTQLIEGSLPYMSPEQTGRARQSVDARTDLYSLGVTLFQLRAGRLPFHAEDALGWMHCHLATPPPKLTEVSRGTPPLLSAIVDKLLAKGPEDRYQSAASLGLDLERALDEHTSTGHIQSFALGQRAISDRFQVPSRLYGREAEVALLSAALERVISRGVATLVLVSGYSGIGKSVLVRELYKPLVHARGYFLEGKCDQVQRGAPYSTVAQAFGAFVTDLLTQGEAEIERWRKQFLTTLGPNAQLLVNLLPPLEAILGMRPSPQTPGPSPSPNEENRFRLAFRRFLSVFARREHPLTLFLEDLQWADSATLNLMEDVLSHNDTPYLLLVGAYRSNEVGPSHPLSARIARLETLGVPIEHVALGPLTKGQVTQLVADAVRRPRREVEQLAALIHDHTAGNPFFAVQLLTTLHQEGFLTLDSKSAHWRWNLSAIRARGYSHDVVDLMVRKVRKLPPATQDALKIAACQGNTFKLAILARLRGQSIKQLNADLWEAVRLGVISRFDGAGRFLHDRLQQVSLWLLPEEERAGVQLQIGRQLLALTPQERLAENIFDIVNPFNQGTGQIQSAAERLQLAQLNLMAGRRAKSEAAYGAAVHYLTAGVKLLPEEAWEAHPSLTFDLHLERASAEYLNKAFERAQEALSLLLARPLTLIQRASVYEVGVQLETTTGKVGRAVQRGLEYLSLCGIEVPLHPTREQVEEQCHRVMAALGTRSIEELTDFPQMSDPQQQAIISVMARVLPAALFFDINTWSVLTCHSVRTSIENGNTDSSTVAYSSFGTVLGVFFGSYRDGHRFGVASLALLERRGLWSFRANVYLFNCLVNYWVEPISLVLPSFDRSFRAGVESGELAFACYACTLWVTALLTQGAPLAEVQRVSEAKLAFVRRERFETVAAGIVSSQLLVQSLTGYGDLDEAQHERRIQKLWSIEICLFYIRKLQSRFFSNRFEEVIVAAELAKPHLWSCQNLMQSVDYVFFRALAQAQLGQREGLVELSQRLWGWAANCRENFETRAALVSAELARLNGDSFHAMRLYEQAVRSAREQGFVHDEAIAHELASHFYVRQGFLRFAQLSMELARACYLRWGAEAKVRALDLKHPSLLPKTTQATTHAATFTARLWELDLLSVMKASQTISGEMLLEDLAPTLMRVVIEQGSAQRGYLLLERDGNLTVEARGEFDDRGLSVELMAGTPIAHAQLVPLSIIGQAVRTQAYVILDASALETHPYREDDYLRRRRPRSALCLPIRRRAETVGYLYLENALTGEAFTPERLIVLELLASQAAISIDNARLLTRERAARRRAEQAQHQAAVLAETSGLLAESLSHSEILSGLARVAVRELGGWCQFDLLERGAIRRVAGAHADATKMVLLQELAERYPPRLNAAKVAPAARVMSSGGTVMISEVTEEFLHGSCENEEHEQLIRELGTQSAIALPLQARGKTLGVLTMGSPLPRRFGEVEVELIEELARRGALAFENALLYEKAQEAIRIRDDFLSIASHELRTPLTPLHLQIRTLQRKLKALQLGASRTQEFEGHLDILLRQSRRLTRLVNELLDISRITGKRLQLEFQWVDLARAVRNVLGILREQEALERGGTEVHVLEQGAVVGYWDLLRIEQVVTHLVSNAVKFGAGKPVDIQVSQAQGMATLAVVDRGIGIPLEAQERIFDQFERAVSGRHYGGLGLGLFIVKQIVDALGGTLSVYSRPEEGATFTISLPLSGPPREEAPAHEEGHATH